MAARLLVYAWLALPQGGLAAAMCQYDCGWYARLATLGYASDSGFGKFGVYPNWAFFPLYPLLLRASVWASTLPAELAGIFLSSALYVGFVVVAAAYLRRTRPASDLAAWVVFSLLFPFGFTFSAVYAESLFALLLTLSVLLLRDGRPLAAGIATALLCAARPTGVLMLPLIAVDRLRHLWMGRARPDRAALLAEALLPLAIAPLGLSISMAVQYALVGDALAFNRVQILWNREWHGPLHYLIEGFAAWDWGQVLKPRELFSSSYDALWAMIGLGVAGVLGWRRRWKEAWLLGACILLPLSSGLHSIPRFVATNPFFLFACFAAASRLRRPAAVAAVYGGMGFLQAAVVAWWYQASNALY